MMNADGVLLAVPEDKPWLTVKDAALYTALSTDTIYTACERRELRHAKVGGRRAIRIKATWIDEWLERHASDKAALHC
jgi:excisionase family DNA binding protein